MNSQRTRLVVIAIVSTAVGSILASICSRAATVTPAPTPTLSPKDIVRRFYEGVNHKNLEIIDEVLSPDFKYHDPDSPEINDREQFRNWTQEVFALLDNIQEGIKDMITEGEKVVVRYTFSATYKNVPISHDGIAIYQFANNQIVETWEIWDAQGFSQQWEAIEKQPS
jgi:ketosteroid isomerase-like protein